MIFNHSTASRSRNGMWMVITMLMAENIEAAREDTAFGEKRHQWIQKKEPA